MVGWYLVVVWGVYQVPYATYLLRTLQSAYLVSGRATVSQNQTLTTTIAEISTTSATSLVPASGALGLTGGQFGALAIIVIGVLTVMTLWVALKSKHAQAASKRPSISS